MLKEVLFTSATVLNAPPPAMAGTGVPSIPRVACYGVSQPAVTDATTSSASFAAPPQAAVDLSDWALKTSEVNWDEEQGQPVSPKAWRTLTTFLSELRHRPSNISASGDGFCHAVFINKHGDRLNIEISDKDQWISIIPLGGGGTVRRLIAWSSAISFVEFMMAQSEHA